MSKEAEKREERLGRGGHFFKLKKVGKESRKEAFL